MKIFISACTAFTLALIFAVCSSLYTRSTVSASAEYLSRLPDVTEENGNTPENVLGCIKEADLAWSKKARAMSFFISHRELDEIDALWVTLRSSAESRDSGHYASTLAALKERLEKLSSTESFSAVGIF